MSTPKRKPKRAAARKPREKIAKKKAVRVRKPEKKIVEPVEKVPAKRIEEVAPEKAFILAVRLLGPFGVPSSIENALISLRLSGRFNAVLLDDNPSMVGMLRKVKDYVTWGKVKDGEISTLLKERGQLIGGLPLGDKFAKDSFGETSVEELAAALVRGKVDLDALWKKGVKPVFRLHPPSGGFGFSIKRPYGKQGELGDRGSEIAALVNRMS